MIKIVRSRRVDHVLRLVNSGRCTTSYFPGFHVPDSSRLLKNAFDRHSPKNGREDSACAMMFLKIYEERREKSYTPQQPGATGRLVEQSPVLLARMAKNHTTEQLCYVL